MISVISAICFLIHSLLTLISYQVGESGKFLPTSQSFILPLPGLSHGILDGILNVIFMYEID